ncbi:hypothetical protein OZX62_05275 [Bifidobacterium sp. ESL0690]|uniref:hypothetical protein n=1 Tax=Bifidobacterium sp. ESL0690 TaxID=2983214 RepID=UPI0023F7B42C|nr:hypothetical protein [Bifidobacterium sp. ESL0690]WEV47671.1 hypothetical protein OZX62_05275 [Bifidobacterium sp. ESL0690]
MEKKTIPNEQSSENSESRNTRNNYQVPSLSLPPRPVTSEGSTKTIPDTSARPAGSADKAREEQLNTQQTKAKAPSLGERPGHGKKIVLIVVAIIAVLAVIFGTIYFANNIKGSDANPSSTSQHKNESQTSNTAKPASQTTDELEKSGGLSIEEVAQKVGQPTFKDAVVNNPDAVAKYITDWMKNTGGYDQEGVDSQTCPGGAGTNTCVEIEAANTHDSKNPDLSINIGGFLPRNDVPKLVYGMFTTTYTYYSHFAHWIPTAAHVKKILVNKQLKQLNKHNDTGLQVDTIVEDTHCRNIGNAVDNNQADVLSNYVVAWMKKNGYKNPIKVSNDTTSHSISITTQLSGKQPVNLEVTLGGKKQLGLDLTSNGDDQGQFMWVYREAIPTEANLKQIAGIVFN